MSKKWYSEENCVEIALWLVLVLNLEDATLAVCG